MKNVGEWNSNIAMFYLFLFMIPLILLFFRWLVLAFGEITKYVVVEKPVYKTVEKVVYKEKPVYKEKIVYRDKPAIKKDKTDKNLFIDDVVSSLVGLGVNKKQAKILTSNLCEKKKYINAESLLMDCLKYL